MTRRASRVHFDRGDASDLAEYGARAVPCNRHFLSAELVTADRDAVTCGNCRAWLAKNPEPAPWTPPPAGPAQIGARTMSAFETERVRRSIAGDDGSEVEGWRDIDHAMRSWASRRSEDVSSGRSSSDPSRFAGSAASSGDAPPVPRRVLEKLHVQAVERAVREACVDGFVFPGGRDGTGALSLTSGACAFILIQRALESDSERIVERVDERFGVAPTAVQIGIVWRDKRRAIGLALHAQGLLAAAPRARQLYDREVGGGSMALPPGFDLDGWKAIATHMGLGESTCRKLATRGSDPLPVRMFLSTVVARRSELDEWRGRQIRDREHGAA